MVATHCLPSGTLDAGAIPVCKIDGQNTDEWKGAGPYRGVLVFMHQLLLATTFPLMLPTANVSDPYIGTNNSFDLFTLLVADDWIILSVPYPEDYFSGPGGIGGCMTSDVGADPAVGARFNSTSLHWWEHVVDYISRTYGTNFPIAILGMSWGGLHVLKVAEGDTTGRLVGACSHVGATILTEIDTIIGATITDSSGYDAGVNALNAVTFPCLLSYGEIDALAGWGKAGLGTCPGGYALVPSNTDLIIVNAQAAGKPVTRGALAGVGHAVPTAAVTLISDWFTDEVDPLAPATL